MKGIRIPIGRIIDIDFGRDIRGGYDSLPPLPPPTQDRVKQSPPPPPPQDNKKSDK